MLSRRLSRAYVLTVPLLVRWLWGPGLQLPKLGTVLAWDGYARWHIRCGSDYAVAGAHSFHVTVQMP